MNYRLSSNHVLKCNRAELNLIKGMFFLVVLTFPFLSYSQEISKSEKSDVINKIKTLIRANYVFEDKAELINEALEKSKASGRFENINDHKSFANELTESLVAISKDKHFKVQYNPGLVKSRREYSRRQEELKYDDQSEIVEEEEEGIDWNLWYAQKENFGFEKVEVLGGNIGYIKFDFWQPLDWAKSTIDAAMSFVANTDALIIDLTENGGGYSPSDNYLASYFFEEKPTEWMSGYERRTDETETTFTFKEIEGKRYLNKPIIILVSENTFSLAEQFSYAMKHFNKATIIGQASAGAAHAIDFIIVNDNYLIQLPISRSIHPVTKKDWEGTGVIPNIVTANSETLKIAHLKLLNEQIKSLKKQTLVGPILERYEKVKKSLEAQ